MRPPESAEPTTPTTQPEHASPGRESGPTDSPSGPNRPTPSPAPTASTPDPSTETDAGAHRASEPAAPPSLTTPTAPTATAATPAAGERTLTSELAAHIGLPVVLLGRLHSLRRLGGVSFLTLRDRAGLAQAVLEDDGALAGCLPETVLRVAGRVHEEPRARAGVELREVQVDVLARVESPLPFEINKGPLKANLDTYLDHAPIGLRHPVKAAAARLASGVLAGYGEWMRANGFTQISTPKIVGAATEGGANLFTIRYFERDAYLAQSPQLYKQIMVGALERVFEIGHVYRAEPHYTTDTSTSTSASTWRWASYATTAT
ncbi:MAG: amino acid--tRNA ligase-related protein [Chloroflexia bacterium]